ncbi:MAG TPA: hypothetical protein VE954_11215 [Oligoflexus sp.]|uniref:hypothetical protein n=1 Tax=Oligoflexus sp. TaxID=1971216 RepID=UPI002D50E494|nr:hypothetical protein [Oligoflexus sp.]HYX33675.1 hypothetical protein [Oligoflexus sp.]
MKHISLVLILGFLGLGASSPGPKRGDTSENVLDRLERKLMEQEAATLRITAPPVSSSKSRKGPVQRFDMPASVMAAPLPHEAGFDSIAKDLRELEQDADELSGQVEKLKADFLTMADKGNFVEIKLVIEDPNAMVVRSMGLTINKHPVYETQDREGQWLPAPEVLLYAGPLEPGTHELNLKGRIVRRYENNVPLDQNLYHAYDQNIQVIVPAGAFRQGYRLKLAKPEKQNIHAQAVLENYQIP